MHDCAAIRHCIVSRCRKPCFVTTLHLHPRRYRTNHPIPLAHRSVTQEQDATTAELSNTEPACRGAKTGHPSMSADLAMIGKVAVPVLICGLLAACVFPSHRLREPWNYTSDAMGFTYTAAWSISFYPQLLLNFKRRSVIGLSIDFQILNLLGFFCYAAYNVALFFSPAVQHQYHEAFGKNIPVGLEDVLFSVHAFIITALTLIQCALYERGEQKFDTVNGRLAVGVAVTAAAAFGGVAISQSREEPFPHVTWINLLLALSAVKLFISLIKYIPQVILNATRRSTEGWSILNVLLDWLGGVLSVAQIVMQCAVLDDWRQIAGNPVKFGLGFVSLTFDVVFMVQHYILYADSCEASCAPDAINLLNQGNESTEA